MSKPEGAERIEVETWARCATFAMFKDYTEPYHGICVRVDCTETFRYAKQARLSVFLSMVHRSLVAANEIDNWRTRIVDGEVWRFQVIHAGSAVGRENGTIGLGHYWFKESLEEFVREGSLEIDRVKQRTDIERYPGQDVIRYSVLPWLDFTSLSHATDANRADSAPRLTFGKITEANGRCTMPVSIHVHHGLADGLHVAQFVDLLERRLAEPKGR
jgi:chloramphenicol O-acetyltransferase type A